MAGCSIQAGTPAAEGCRAHKGESDLVRPSAGNGSSAGRLGCWTTRCGNGQQAKVLEEEGARAVIGAARGKLARDKLL